MKHSITAWVLAVTLIAALTVINVSSRRGQQTHYLDASRARLLQANPFNSAMPVDRDDPLVDRFNEALPAMPEDSTDPLANGPTC